MNLELCHGYKEKDRDKLYLIETTNKFSVAVFLTSENNSIDNFYHSHDAYEFVIPVTTPTLLKCGDAVMPGEVGYCYPVEPGINHGIEFDLNSSMISIVIDKEYMNSYKRKLRHEKDHFFHKFLVSMSLLMDLWNDYIKNNYKAFDKIVEYFIIEGFKIDNQHTSRESKYFVNFKESVLYVMNNYTDPDLTIEDIANQSSYSITYFTKVFKKYMNDTPVNCLNKLRLSKAKELMKDKSLSLEQVSKLSGYKTNSCFTEAFKRIVGMTPFEYRKKYL